MRNLTDKVDLSNVVAKRRRIRGRELRRSLRYDRESVYRTHVVLTRKKCKVHDHVPSIKYIQLICADGCAIYKLQVELVHSSQLYSDRHL
ncbi:hypothetical protein EVAR_36418_1 [Eumeta japonica]|uniref:Uncharacterized protein n=1 Tax=Eumeta variegata TaxID=151549 RepID=A0A4C1VQL8_EUMVA|nr:hypothetical protein EVAR_36418_1 [Eumeta japonica]